MLPVICIDLKEQDERQRTDFMVEIARLRELLTRPRIHVVVFDCHGSLTDKKAPESTERPYGQIGSLYHEFSELGTEIVISTAWHDMSRILDSLRAASVEKTAAILTETVVEERTQTEYTIVHSGNVISARREPHFQRFF